MTGLEFRTWRRERELTQAALANLLEVNSMTVSNWERGRYPIPRWVPRVLSVIDRPQENALSL